ncbi:MFS transporter [Lederbergia galactosidilytica]|uniref:Membrane protein n=1 Tax=Lederbergia galactosidilytica TaxID=217031 RepID=A0A177ZJZ9_9BACI|nr:MFS transporter [Lederbergia galactosidilytica]MBP1915310.1 fucose permease [Lederbergia galactosidilytica]OAK68135.1 membrane protein [Lederbergia galactosidilytica]
MGQALSAKQIRLWRIAVYFYFGLSGFAMASWVSQTPNIRDALGVSTAQMGWIIFGLSTGSIIGLLCASRLIIRFGGRVIMLIGLTLSSVGLVTIGLGSSWVPHVFIVFSALAIFGFGIGICDVAMNVEGTAIEKTLKKSILTGFHAVYSLGTFFGAMIGSLANKFDFPIMAHLFVIAFIVFVLIVYFSRFVPIGPGQEDKEENINETTAKETFSVWKEQRTVLLGIIVLGMAFAEGSAGDWLPLVIVDGYDKSPASGSLMFSLFVATMTISRAVGDILLNKFGRVAILRASALSAAVGLVIVIFGGNYYTAALGIVLWGFGSAYGFPIGLSAAGDNPHGVAARVGAVTTVGYMAFLVGPPVLGAIAESIGLLRSLIFVLIGVTVAGLLAHAAKPVSPVKKLEADVLEQ